MNAALQSNLTNLQLANYVILVIISAIGYDYVLTLSREIEYIWSKPWTFVSTLFVIVRYLGLYGFIIDSIQGTSFLPGPANLCLVLNIATQWTLLLYAFAADLLMILHVWAMHNRSKIVISALLASYTVTIVLSIIACIVTSSPKSWTVTVIPVLDVSFCELEMVSSDWSKVSSITQLIHVTALCALVVIQFAKQSIQMYRAIKQWRLGPFVNLLVVEGVVYFFVMLSWNLMNVLELYPWGKVLKVGPQSVVPTILHVVPLSTLIPRFVLNMRELYARSVRGGHTIDTGFGFSTLGSHGVICSSIAFADFGEEEKEGLEHSELDVSMKNSTSSSEQTLSRH